MKTYCHEYDRNETGIDDPYFQMYCICYDDVTDIGGAFTYLGNPKS